MAFRYEVDESISPELRQWISKANELIELEIDSDHKEVLVGWKSANRDSTTGLLLNLEHEYFRGHREEFFSELELKNSDLFRLHFHQMWLRLLRESAEKQRRLVHSLVESYVEE